MLARNIEKAGKVIEKTQNKVVEKLEDFTQSARQTARKIGDILRKRTDEAQGAGKEQDQALITMAEKTIQQAGQVKEQLGQQTGKAAKGLKQTLTNFVSLAEKVVDQTKRQILKGESVPAQEEVLSIFEPHTDVICRGKKNHPVEYGHKIWLDEVDGGIVSHYRILDSNPNDETQWEPSLTVHEKGLAHHPNKPVQTVGYIPLTTRNSPKTWASLRRVFSAITTTLAQKCYSLARMFITASQLLRPASPLTRLGMLFKISGYLFLHVRNLMVPVVQIGS